MKKLANLEGVKALNRKEQKEIFGGCTSLLKYDDGGGGSEPYAKCCWDNDPTNCSSCEIGSNCSAGSHLVNC